MGQNRILNISRLGPVQELDGIQISPIQLDNANSLGSVGEEIISDYPGSSQRRHEEQAAEIVFVCICITNLLSLNFHIFTLWPLLLQLALEQRDSKQSCQMNRKMVLFYPFYSCVCCSCSYYE